MIANYIQCKTSEGKREKGKPQFKKKIQMENISYGVRN